MNERLKIRTATHREMTNRGNIASRQCVSVAHGKELNDMHEIERKVVIPAAQIGRKMS